MVPLIFVLRIRRPPMIIVPGAVTLTSSSTVAIYKAIRSGQLYLARSQRLPACGTPLYDVWYTFTSQTTARQLPEFTGANSPMRIYNAIRSWCKSAHHSCSNTAASQHPASQLGLLIFKGLFYQCCSGIQWYFHICVDDPAPANDDCAGCNHFGSGHLQQYSGNMVGATLTASIPAPTGCGTPSYDVGIPSRLCGQSDYHVEFHRQRFHTMRACNCFGSCASLAHVSCTLLPAGSIRLTIGSTYYVRVYSTSAVPFIQWYF